MPLPAQVATALPPRATACGTAASNTGALPTWRANRVLSYIESNLSDRILVSQLARLAGVSHSHLMRTFKVRFGITLRVYMTCRRIAAAQHLMLVTNEPLCGIALGVGMCDQAHFSRIFRRFVGVPPSRWRALQLDAQSCGDTVSSDTTADLLNVCRRIEATVPGDLQCRLKNFPSI